MQIYMLQLNAFEDTGKVNLKCLNFELTTI